MHPKQKKVRSLKRDLKSTLDACFISHTGKNHNQFRMSSYVIGKQLRIGKTQKQCDSSPQSSRQVYHIILPEITQDLFLKRFSISMAKLEILQKLQLSQQLCTQNPAQQHLQLGLLDESAAETVNSNITEFLGFQSSAGVCRHRE